MRGFYQAQLVVGKFKLLGYSLLHPGGCDLKSVSTWKGLVLLILLAAAVFMGSLLVGSAELSPGRVLAALLGSGDSVARAVTLTVRLPRTLAAFGVGSLLALAGVLLQALFRNPLADPFVLGVSGGAAVGALLAMIAGATMLAIQGSAVAGAVVAVVIVHLLARSGGTTRLLLTGVVLASACGALVTVLLSVADASSLRGMVFWLAGDLEWAVNPWGSALTASLAVAFAVLMARPLNVLAAGELRARSVGMNLEAWRSFVFLACAALTAVAVVSAGTVGFVGLVTPHIVRLSFRTSDHRVVAPASALLGGTLLACADVAARTVVAPRQLPVGAIMALVGAPLFIALLRRRG
jgi:iron complex transport system permease protein